MGSEVRGSQGRVVLLALLVMGAVFAGSLLLLEATLRARTTSLTLAQSSLSFAKGASWTNAATLAMGGISFEQQTIFFTAIGVTGAGAGQTFVTSALTNAQGVATVGGFNLPIGTYTLTASFGEVVQLGGGKTYDATNPRYVGSHATGTVAITVPPKAIAFTSGRDGNLEIYTMAGDGSGQTRLTNNANSDFGPVFSPDGTRIAFTSDRDGNSEIYVMSADGTGVTRLTNNSAVDVMGSWSPDGTKIAFTSTRDGNSEIYLMNADGSGVVRLTTNKATDADPAFSPDGTMIGFTSTRDGNSEIYVMKSDGTGVTRLTNNTAIDTMGRFSPDGSKIVFVSNRSGSAQIWVMSASGGSATQLTSAGPNATPRWSLDGTKIVFSSTRDANAEIYVMNADGSGQTRLTNNSALDTLPDIR